MNSTINIIIIIVLIIVSIIVLIGGFLLAYKLYLWRIPGFTFLDTYMKMIPFVGDWAVDGWGRTSGFTNIINNPTSFYRPDLNSEKTEIGVREGTRSFGHGSACAWNKSNCNLFDNGQLGKYEEPGMYTDQQKNIMVEEDIQKDVHIQLQMPMQKKVFESIYAKNNINSKTGSSMGMYKKPSEMEQQILATMKMDDGRSNKGFMVGNLPMPKIIKQ